MTPKESNSSDLLATVHALSRADKLRLMQALVADLAREEGIQLLENGASYPVWTPQNAFDAAQVMLQSLEAEEAAP